MATDVSESRQMTELVGVRLRPDEMRRAEALAAGRCVTVPELFRQLLVERVPSTTIACPVCGRALRPNVRWSSGTPRVPCHGGWPTCPGTGQVGAPWPP